MSRSPVLKKLNPLIFTIPLTALAFIPLIASCSDNKQPVINETISSPTGTSTQTIEPIAIDNGGINHAEKTKTTTAKTICNNAILDNSVLPSMVLAGTDVFEKSAFETAVFSAGSFNAEIGGATLSIRLTPTPKGLAKLTRKYEEPGLEIDEKTYNNLCVESNRVYSATILLEFVSDGVLLWEGSSENEFIPSDLFMHLKGAN